MDFETIREDELPDAIDFWSEETVVEKRHDGVHLTDSMVEAFIHPDTGTAARIMEQTEGFSVQPSMGDFGDYDYVIQPEHPTELVSGWSSVVALDVETRAQARNIAFAWIDAWINRGNLSGSEPGDIYES